MGVLSFHVGPREGTPGFRASPIFLLLLLSVIINLRVYVPDLEASPGTGIKNCSELSDAGS